MLCNVCQLTSGSNEIVLLRCEFALIKIADFPLSVVRNIPIGVGYIKKLFYFKICVCVFVFFLNLKLLCEFGVHNEGRLDSDIMLYDPAVLSFKNKILTLTELYFYK